MLSSNFENLPLSNVQACWSNGLHLDNGDRNRTGMNFEKGHIMVCFFNLKFYY